MDWLSFLASLVSSIAWPTAVVVAIYLLRKPLGSLLANLSSFKFKDIEVQFGKKLETLEKELGDTSIVPDLPEIQTDQTIEDRFDALVEISPSAAIIDSWIRIDSSLKNLAARADIDERSRRVPVHTIRALVDAGEITRRLGNLLDELRGLRNQAAHLEGERQITVNEARRYKNIADQVFSELERAIYASGPR